jgi:alpha-galactosidase
MTQNARYFVLQSVLALIRTLLTGLILIYALSPTLAPAEQNGVAKTPQMGWSTWSFIRRSPTEAIMKAQALAMHQNLQSYGFTYVNLDDFWYLDPSTTVDEYGRWQVDTSKFPDGMAALGAYIHSLGLKFGMYITPGIPVAAYNQNTKIEGSKYHARDIADTSQYETNYNYGSNVMYYINYDKAGAQEYINSWANIFASWGVDYIKLDGVGIGDFQDVLAWSKALVRTGRPIHFALSNSLALPYASDWEEYSNSWRISGDIEAYQYESNFGTANPYPLTAWTNVLNHFQLASQWTHYGGPGGWNDLDSLEIGNGANDGTNAGTSSFTENERQSLMSYWAMAAAPLILGTDLTAGLNSYDYKLLGNTEVIAVDQAGVPGAPIDDYLNLDPKGTNPRCGVLASRTAPMR